VTEWWLDDMYLNIRLPLPINSSPGMVFPRRRFAKIDEPLCMEQFYRLLGGSRVPGRGKDRLVLPARPADPDDCEELFYAVPVKAADRGRLTPGEIQAQLLHAMVDAASAPPAPRLIISSDGTVGMCYEHSAAEGVAVVRLAERALARAEVSSRPSPPPALLPAPPALRWQLSPRLLDTVRSAAIQLDRAIADLDMKVFTYRGYGREFMKSCRCSPDVYIQLALQYAYYKMYGHLVSTYESASLRRFRDGRVDNIRSAHPAALAWATHMSRADNSPPPATPQPADDGQKKVSFNLHGEQKKIELFEEAARKQTKIMQANIQGQGIDNHLLGLRETARETLGHLPPIFTDSTYQKMLEFKLSTSQVASTTPGTFMGYGAVVPDGYGCSYNPKPDCVIFCISSFVPSSLTNTDAFTQSLAEALDSMKLMFQHRKPDN
ncbi:unnamed protein product, partial [Leptidea sinapis]